MRRGVKTHVSIATVPVDLRAHGHPDRKMPLPFSRRIHDVQCIVRRGAFALDLARIGHARACTVGGDDESSIARLSPTEWIKNGAVELDTVITDARDSCVALTQVSVFAKQRLCCHSNVDVALLIASYGLVGRFSVVHSGMPPRN